MRPGHDRPVNATAGRVVAQGESYEFPVTSIIYDSPTPLETWTPIDPYWKDLSGLKIGRLLVIGFSRDFKGKWVCRCACGTYCVRSKKALTSTTHQPLPCHQCYRLAVKRKSDFFKRTGKDACVSDFL